MPDFVRGVLALLLVVVGGCTAAPPPPDAAYRSALQAALEDARCGGPKIDAVWDAYNRWYAVASTNPYYHPGSEADALLLQAAAFRSLGCDSVARQTYEALLNRFTDDSFARHRAQAVQGLDALGPPFPLSGPATRTAARPAF